MTTNLVVADDQTMIREALVQLLGMAEQFLVVGQASDGEELLNVLKTLESCGVRVDVILMDVEMPKIDGLAACAIVRRQFPQTKVLVVTTFGRPGYVRRALEAGAHGFVVKDAPLPQLVLAIERVNEGHKVVDPALAVETLHRGESPLTYRETEVLEHLQSGLTLVEVARALGLSSGTVRNYASSAMDKLGAQTHVEAVGIARDSGWLSPG